MLINLKMAQEIVELFGGDEETELDVSFFTKAHADEGYYVSHPDYPEDGCSPIGMTETDKMIRSAISACATPTPKEPRA